MPQVSYRLDGEGSRYWASAPCCGLQRALGPVAALGGDLELEIGQPMEFLYGFIFAAFVSPE